jgi:hypothetical protein
VNRPGAAPLLLGLAAGILLGLVFGWVVEPMRFQGTAPDSLRADFRDEYAALIASAYAATGDLPRARARLSLLPDVGDADHVAALAQARLAAGRPQAEVQALAMLAAALGDRPPTPTASALATGTSPTPASTPTLVSTPKPRPTPLPTATPGSPFVLESREAVCDDPAPLPRLQVVVLDAAGQGVANLLVRVIWDQGQDQFYTGLKPDRGVGFGDFTMQPETEYTVQLADSDVVVSGIRSQTCTDSSGKTFPGSWRLTFVQPGAP